jgi:hypothetical protein
MRPIPIELGVDRTNIMLTLAAKPETETLMDERESEDTHG